MFNRLSFSGNEACIAELCWSHLAGLSRHRDALASSLSASERTRAKRYRFAEHRERYSLARGALRSLLAAKLDCQPAEVVLTEEPGGKPRLADQMANDLRFNVSHSKDIVVYALSEANEVGVDVEFVDDSLDRAALLRSFSAGERACYYGSPAADRVRTFFRLWTRKEARDKAVGSGLVQSAAARDDLSLAEFAIEGGYLGTVVVVVSARPRPTQAENRQ